MGKLRVYYRIADVKLPASNPPPIYEDDCFELTRLCLETFIEAFKKIDPKVVFICDHCPESYKHLIKVRVPFEHEIMFTNLGINETCLLQYDLYEDSDADKVVFLEYDYFWKPHGDEIVSAIDEFDFVTPYDHPDKYEKEKRPEVVVHNGRHWKKTQSTTATFATNRKNYEEYKELFKKWGYLDHKRWIEIGENGGELWSPIPTIATHMSKNNLSPNVNWSFNL